jgi:hypothetical protein
VDADFLRFFSTLTRQGRLAAVVLILAVAAFLRYWGIAFGFPHHNARPDESYIVLVALHMLRGDPNPQTFIYPTLFMYVVAAFYGVYYAVGHLLGSTQSVQALRALWEQTPNSFLLTSRAIAAAFGTATVLMLYLVGRQLFGYGVGIVSALFLSLAYLHVSQSHFGLTDIPMTFMVLWAFLLICRVRDDDSGGPLKTAGFVAGLAASTKYNAVLIGLPLALAVLFRAGSHHRAGTHYRGGSHNGESATRRWVWPCVQFGSFLMAGFLVGTPFAVLNAPKFIADLKYQSGVLKEGHLFAVPDPALYHAHITLWYGLGWPLLASSLLGFAVLAWRDWRTALLVGAFPAAHYFTISQSRAVFVRYADPLLPFLCLAAAVFVVWAGEYLLRGGSSRTRAAAIVGLSTAIIIPSAWKSVEFDRLVSRTDNRVLASEWIQANIPPGQSVYLTGMAVYAQPELPRGRYRLCRFDPLNSDFTCDTSSRELPDWIVVSQYPLEAYSPAPQPQLQDVLSRKYDVVKTFAAYQQHAGDVFDYQDAFYLPFSGFSGVDRPGPNLVVFRRRD